MTTTRSSRRAQRKSATDGAHDASDLLGAAERGELVVQYQPVLDAQSHEVAGFEALLRWRHPVHGLLTADAFTAAIEHGRRALELDRWILRSACTTAATWPSSIHVAVNISPLRLIDRTFTAQVRDVLDRAGLDPRRLSIELIERAPVLPLPSVLANVRDLHQLGVSFALDDFLVDHSSWDSLTTLSADVIKLDRSFVDPLNHGGASPIAEAVIELAHRLGLLVVAEGIETPQGEAGALALGCDRLQGFLYSPAVSAEHTPSLLTALGALSAARPRPPALERTAVPEPLRPTTTPQETTS